jgi:hypothetical protein
MAERVPEVEQRAKAGGFALVRRHDPRLAPHCGGDRLGAGGEIPGDHGGAVRFQPREQLHVFDQRVFGDLA